MIQNLIVLLLVSGAAWHVGALALRRLRPAADAGACGGCKGCAPALTAPNGRRVIPLKKA